MGISRAQVRGVLQTVRAGHAPARILAVTDSRAVVRSLFLASAVRAPCQQPSPARRKSTFNGKTRISAFCFPSRR